MWWHFPVLLRHFTRIEFTEHRAQQPATLILSASSRSFYEH